MLRQTAANLKLSEDTFCQLRRRSEQFCCHSICGRKLDLISESYFKFWNTWMYLSSAMCNVESACLKTKLRFNYFLSFSGTGWNSMMWPATTGSPWSARRPRVRRRKQHHRGSAPAGRDSSLSRILPYLRAFLLALYLDGSNTEPHKSSLFTSSISVSLTSLQSLGIAIYSIFIVYWKIHLYKPNVSYFCILQLLPRKFRSKSEIVGCPKT